jgi:hypothetical protein
MEFPPAHEKGVDVVPSHGVFFKEIRQKNIDATKRLPRLGRGGQIIVDSAPQGFASAGAINSGPSVFGELTADKMV